MTLRAARPQARLCETSHVTSLLGREDALGRSAVLSRAEWLQEMRAHHAWVDEVSRGHRHRRAAGMKHPVEDFLWQYYPFSPARLRRWTPGARTTLQGVLAGDPLPQGFVTVNGSHRFRADALPAKVQERLRTDTAWVLGLQQQTRQRSAGFGCFGLHEWAMVLDQTPEQVRHTTWSLRVTPAQLSDTIENLGLRCTHFDAWRFFTPRATAMNPVALSRQSQPEMDQPGCLHANMDLYKWSMRLQPLIASTFVRAAFELARRIRTVDMRASPYDFRALGLEPINIEAAAGRAEFIELQRGFATRAQQLRDALISELDQVRESL